MEWIESTSLEVGSSREAIEEALGADRSRPIGIVPWKDYPLKTNTSWSLLHGKDAFFLGFICEEPTNRAVLSKPGDPVCQDSCVEWFFDWGEGVYLNVEINPIGTSTLERGSGREGREQLLDLGAPGFRSWGSLGIEPFEERPAEGPWKAWAVLPYDLGPVSREGLLKKGGCANFYKCGDQLSEPHYNTWGPMSSPNPDFHQPKDFSQLSFRSS